MKEKNDSHELASATSICEFKEKNDMLHCISLWFNYFNIAINLKYLDLNTVSMIIILEKKHEGYNEWFS